MCVVYVTIIHIPGGFWKTFEWGHNPYAVVFEVGERAKPVQLIHLKLVNGVLKPASIEVKRVMWVRERKKPYPYTRILKEDPERKRLLVECWYVLEKVPEKWWRGVVVCTSGIKSRKRYEIVKRSLPDVEVHVVPEHLVAKTKPLILKDRKEVVHASRVLRVFLDEFSFF